MGRLINVTQGGKTFAIDESQLEEARRQGFHVEGEEEAAARVQSDVNQERFDNAPGKVVAGGLGLARGVTGGLSDVGLRVAGVDPSELATIREVNPTTSTVTEIAGALAPTGVGGLAARAGERVGRVAEGAGALAEIGGAARGAAVEGAILGTGQGVSELALSDDPITLERAASVLGSNALIGAGTGGVLGAAGKTAEKALVRAKGALDKLASKGAKDVDAATADIATLDMKGLRAAQKAEIDAIEQARVPARAQIADEVKALRAEMKENKIWLATKDADAKAIKEVREVGKTALEADRSIDRMLRNPKALAQRPQRVLDGLQQQEHALERLVGQADNLRNVFAKDASGARQAALDYASTALEKNRAIQAKIVDITSKPASARLEAIETALAGGATKPAGQGIGSIIGDSALGYAVGAAAGIPGLGTAIAAGRVGLGILKKLGADTSAAAARTSSAIEKFLAVAPKVAGKAAPAAPVLATKILSSVRYAPEAPRRRGRSEPQLVTKNDLATHFARVSKEIRSQVAPDGMGGVAMRPEARAQIARHLTPIRAVSPVLADRIESHKAHAVEFLAGKLPKKPDLPGVDEHWPTSDMEMRTFARYVAAIEDPNGVIERLADGTVTPEDAEAMRTVYPEMYAQVQAEIMAKLGEIRAKLPYQRRLALSIFSGVPCDPVLDPRVLAALQGSYAEEPGTDGGIQPPRAQPAFGSISKQKGTPAQERAAG